MRFIVKFLYINSCNLISKFLENVFKDDEERLLAYLRDMNEERENICKIPRVHDKPVEYHSSNGSQIKLIYGG